MRLRLKALGSEILCNGLDCWIAGSVRNGEEAEALLADIQQAINSPPAQRRSLLQSLPRFSAQRVLTDGMLRQVVRIEGPT